MDVVKVKTRRECVVEVLLMADFKTCAGELAGVDVAD